MNNVGKDKIFKILSPKEEKSYQRAWNKIDVRL